MKIKITKRWKAFPFIEIDIMKYHLVIILFVSGKWEKWQIKKGFYVKVFKFHPFEMAVYF